MEICAERVGSKAGVFHPYGLARQEKAKHITRLAARTSFVLSLFRLIWQVSRNRMIQANSPAAVGLDFRHVFRPYGLARQEKAKHCKKKSQMYYFARTSSDIVKGRCIDVYKNPSSH